jgi:hypothetical protein
MSTQPSEIIFAVEEAPEGGFVARALGHSIFTEADDLDALRHAVRDAVRCHFEDAARPKVILPGVKGNFKWGKRCSQMDLV